MCKDNVRRNAAAPGITQCDGESFVDTSVDIMLKCFR